MVDYTNICEFIPPLPDIEGNALSLPVLSEMLVLDFIKFTW